MKRFASISLFLCFMFGIFLLTPPGANSETVNLTFTGVGGASSGGEYIFPYYFTVGNGSTTLNNVPLMCISFDKRISSGESWTADVAKAASLGTKYKEAAYLFHLASTSGSPNTVSDAQWAAWDLFDPSAGSTNPGTGSDISSLLATALANAGSYGMYDILVAEDGTESNPGLGTAQTFVGPPAATPEPGTLVLVGTATLGLAFLLCYKKRTFARDCSS